MPQLGRIIIYLHLQLFTSSSDRVAVPLNNFTAPAKDDGAQRRTRVQQYASVLLGR